ncbi:hypothetical protein N431DRAFT_478780 [Stipitochalara longipes BDJ]|nr:hypothetical protein N431DRAFT_478780 [Stipitochalara longipes BDJ]
MLNIPSWVIDYSHATYAVDICGINPGLDVSAPIRGQFPGFSFTQTTLRCYGAQFDTVDEVQLGTLADAIDSETAFRNLLRFYLSMPLEIRGRRRIELFWRTLIVNTHDTFDPGNAPILFEHNFLAWFTLKLSFKRHGLLYSEMINLLDTMGAPDEKGILEDVDALCDWYSSAEQGLEPSSNDGQFLREVRQLQDAYTTFSTPFCHLSYGRKLFITKKGMLGMGLETVQKGDQVWLLCDGRTPFVLRGKGRPSDFTLNGACYMHDFMHGEMLDDEWGLKERIGRINII